MGLRKVEIQKLNSVKGGMLDFYSPQPSHETMLAQIPPHTVEEMFVHRYQTDQLLVVRGSIVMVILENRRYQYIPLSEEQPLVVKIPPGVLHGAINLNSQPCLVVNAVLRHGAYHERDYRPLKPPFPYDIATVQSVIKQGSYPVTF